ncbi:hypothetical protein HK097_010824, partial [Rhizophlyctis rosea]
TSLDSYTSLEHTTLLSQLQILQASHSQLLSAHTTLQQDLKDTQFAYDSVSEKCTTYQDVCESLQGDCERLRGERDKWKAKARGAEEWQERAAKYRREREEARGRVRELEGGGGGTPNSEGSGKKEEVRTRDGEEVKRVKEELKRVKDEVEKLKKERDEAVEIAVAKSVEARLHKRGSSDTTSSPVSAP